MPTEPYANSEEEKPQDLAAEVGQDSLAGVMDWFGQTVERLETAYQDLGSKFERVNQELEETNRRLELNQKRLSALLKSMQPGVIMVDPLRSLAVLNDSAKRMLGIGDAELLGRPITEVFDAHSGVGKCLLQALEQDSDELQVERIFHLDGRDIPVAVTGSRVIDSDGMLLGAMETFTDLTELKRMQAEMQQDRVLRALGEMAATVAHEIRNPLGGIGGYAGLLARGIPPEDPRRKLVDKIIQGVSSLNKIVSNLLVYTRKSNLQRVPVELSEWFEGIIAHAEIEIEKEGKAITMVREFAAAPIWAEIDPERFQQVALNLIINAMQAIENQGEIRVRLICENAWAFVEIEDTGKGIPSESLTEIFTPFFTTKEQGTGLGLAIVRKLIEEHEGDITVRSTLGQGTTFRLSLRRAEPPDVYFGHGQDIRSR